MDLLQKYLGFHSASQTSGSPFLPDSHLPGTYRGGIVAKFQRLLAQEDDGSIVSATTVPAITGTVRPDDASK
jgi:hypothetical protein